MSSERRLGGCACGAVRFMTTAPPRRSGLCHCLTCQKAHGSAFFPFVVFARDQVELKGTTIDWASTPSYERRACAVWIADRQHRPG